ncbi:MAG: type II secretion system F family protein [Deltaproteobacteria bacterium]|nr:type II secretion system F family protein [Deltaproteobacteria bacterium]
MPVFVWEARNRSGVSRKGEFEAADEAAAVSHLKGQMLTGINVKPKGFNVDFANITFGAKIKTRELVVFTRQFATMIDAGLPLVQCLDIIASQQENKFFKKSLFQVKEDVESGATFADSLRKHKDIFDDLYVNLVAAGEVGGILDTILNRLAAYLEKMDKLKRQIKGALVYPTSVLVVAIGVVAAMLIWVIPVFRQMFEDFGGTLPLPTQIVITISDFLRGNLIYMIVGIVLAISGLRRYYGTAQGRKVIDQLLLKLPIIGPLIQKVAIARFSRTLGTMLSSGVPILDALDVVARTAGNKIVELEVYKARESIASGKTIAEPLGESKVFPSMVVQMVAVGESTGAMDTMLAKVADFYENEVDAAVAALTSLLEPMLMVFLGGTVGGLLVAMYLPIFKIADTVG